MNCQILLYLPWAGTIGIPVEQLNGKESLTITYAIECIQGGVTVQVRAGEYVLYTGSSNMGVPYCIGSSNVPLQSLISGQMQMIGGSIQAGFGIVSAAASGGLLLASQGIVGGGSPGGLLGSIGSGINNVVQGTMQSLTPVVQSTGAVSGSSALGLEIKGRISILYFDPIDDAGFQSLYGHPVMKVGKPAAGYCQTKGFSIASTWRAEILAKVNSMMDSGVFIE